MLPDKLAIVKIDGNMKNNFQFHRFLPYPFSV